MNYMFIITGLSGSGKTYKLKQESEDKINIPLDNFINLDEVTKYYRKNKLPKNKYVQQFISQYHFNVDKKYISWENDKFNIHNQFIKYISTLDGTFYIEGIQFIKPYIDMEFLVNNITGLYITDKCPIVCLFSRIKRCINSDKSFKDKIKNLFIYDLNPVHIIEIFQLYKFANYVSPHYDDIYKRRLKYEFMK